jgi:hypothetical protein
LNGEEDVRYVSIGREMRGRRIERRIDRKRVRMI